MTALIRKIDESTSVPIKIVVPICGAVAAAAIWIQSTLWEIRSLQREAWTREHMQLWRDRLSANNPTIAVPTVADIAK